MTYLDLLRDAVHKLDKGDITLGEYDRMLEPLKRKIEPERKTGRWVKKVDDGMYWYECSECGDYPLKSAFGHDVYSDWCPRCGAKLEGVES